MNANETKQTQILRRLPLASLTFDLNSKPGSHRVESPTSRPELVVKYNKRRSLFGTGRTALKEKINRALLEEAVKPKSNEGVRSGTGCVQIPGGKNRQPKPLFKPKLFTPEKRHVQDGANITINNEPGTPYLTPFGKEGKPSGGQTIRRRSLRLSEKERLASCAEGQELTGAALVASWRKRQSNPTPLRRARMGSSDLQNLKNHETNRGQVSSKDPLRINLVPACRHAAVKSRSND